jgi:hypothetical protein
MILQQRLISRSSRSLAVMIGFAQPAGSRGTWRCDGDIGSGGIASALALRSPQLLHPSLTDLQQPIPGTRRRAPGCPVRV